MDRAVIEADGLMPLKAVQKLFWTLSTEEIFNLVYSIALVMKVMDMASVVSLFS